MNLDLVDDLNSLMEIFLCGCLNNKRNIIIKTKKDFLKEKLNKDNSSINKAFYEPGIIAENLDKGLSPKSSKRENCLIF